MIDAGEIPNPLAASTDISKVIRMEYGSDIQYMEMVEEALPIWRAWNAELSETVFHETGVAMFSRKEVKKGDYEFDSLQLSTRRGHNAERVNQNEITRRFPAWETAAYVDGFYHHKGGFAESGRAVELLTEKAKGEGVSVYPYFEVANIKYRSNTLVEITSNDHKSIQGNKVLVSAGAWTRFLVPELQSVMKVSGHPVFHLKTKNVDLFRPDVFPVFTADISNTGWYGFPAHPKSGVIKIANHGIGLDLHPTNDERVVLPEDFDALRAFLNDTFPSLLDAEIVYTRRCLYCDTLDEHFWIARHPEIENLFVASGGSGHGFKFAPILGPLIADCIEGKPNPWLDRFKWRFLDRTTQGEEASRNRV